MVTTRTRSPHAVPRRGFLRQAASLGIAATAFSTPLEAWFAASHGRSSSADGYGPLAPVRDEATGLPLLQLPVGFRYISFGWTGDLLDDGLRTPGAHDGMAAFPWRTDRVRLIRNHEVSAGPSPGRPALTYDAGAGGGTTTLEFAPDRGAWIGAHLSLAGTVRNCAGGPTPWHSWLTCEESVVEPGPTQPFQRPHGYVFEVPIDGPPSCEPLVAMGRFVHEAVAIDPLTGFVYETEDASRAGLYRFRPRNRERLAEGGSLEMLGIAGRPRFDTRTAQSPGTSYAVTWVPIEQPERALADDRTQGGGVFEQGWTRGGAAFARLEGAWAGGGKIYVTATSGGNAAMGQVWELDPADATLRLVYESPGSHVLNMPDNICVSPRGGLVLCEDGTANPSVHGLTTEGQLFTFARNNIMLAGETRGITGDFRAREFAGATYSPDGHWLFLNVQSPGVTFAITGPWGQRLL
jgi:uncharacterized protein